jgi:diguanylate cyclase (GGDEF)-like protein/PAS domain S-box-containing protein
MLKNRTNSEGAFYRFSDLVDIDELAQLLESFFKATAIPNGLVSPEGELLTQAGWCDACTLFHRAHPETNQFCQESNLELMQKLREGEVAGSLCKNGLYDYATPVVIEGHQLATLFLGQVHERPPDMAFFRQRACQFNFDEEAYLNAIRAIPVINKVQMEAHMRAMVGVAQILAANTLARLRETQLRLDLDRSTERRIQIEDLLEFSPVGISWCDEKGNIEYLNHQFTELFGYTLDNIPDIETWVSRAYPDAEYRKEVIEPWVQQVGRARQLDLELPKLESNITCKDGSEKRVMTQVSWVGEKRLASFTDISAHWQSEQRNRAHNAMLEMVAKAEPLPTILYTLVQAIEEESPASLCSIMLLDEEGKHLLAGAAPSLPPFYIDAVNGMEIGMGKQSCGTAAYLAERVIVEDISTHKYWRFSADLAKKAGLAACWSEPVIASNGKVLGTFAIFHSEPARPCREDIERIAFAANLAAIAIETRHTSEALIRSEREFRTLADNAPVNIARYDRDGRLIYANRKLTNELRDQIDQVMGKRVGEQPELPFVESFQKAIDHTIRTGKASSIETKVPVSDGGIETHLISMVAEQDESGAIVGTLAMGLNITERKQLEEQLVESERDYRTLAENVPINIARFDHDGQLIYVNSRLAVTLPLPIHQLLGSDISEEGRQPYSDLIEKSVLGTLEDGMERSFEIEIPIAGNSHVTHLMTIVAERDESGNIIGVLATGLDISERKELQRELERQARLDFLTGLLNRRYFIELAKIEILRQQRYGGELSLIMFDIDRFKVINDNYGHKVGDLVLQKIAQVCQQTVREVDIVGRLGGEEFVLLLPNTGKIEAVEAAERLRLAINNGVVMSNRGEPLHFSASFGVVTLKNGSETSHIDELLIRADSAMYRAKENGRNRVYEDLH